MQVVAIYYWIDGKAVLFRGIYRYTKNNWDLQDENCILSKNSKCSIDFKGFRFHSMETLLCALELEMLGDTKHIRQLAKYTRMEYVRRCAKTRFD